MNRRSPLKRLPWIVAMVATQTLTSSAQQPAAPSAASDLQKQLEQLKQQYDATTRDLQQRITALEQQLGLKVEAGKGPHDYLVVDRLERPTPN